MRNQFLIISITLLSFSVVTAYGLPPPPPTSFDLVIIDESNKNVSPPIFLQVREVLNGQEIFKYTIDVIENPTSIPVSWTVPNKAENTKIHIIAEKLGYENSDEFVFTVTSQTPSEGILAEHNFVLKLQASTRGIEIEHNVISFGKTFSVNTISTSNFQSIDFLDNENALLVVLSEDAFRGFTDFYIPTSLLNPPFRVVVDGTTVSSSVEKKGSETVVNLEYSNGLHSISIIGFIDETLQPEDFDETLQPEDFDETLQPEDFDDSQPDTGGGCLIATATYGSELAPQVQQLRELRDNKLLNTESGTSFMGTFNDFYYSFSPIIADYERENPVFKEMVKIAITPMITSLSILNYVDMDSEVEVLGYGISLILLNVGMYVGIPAIVIVGIRKRF